jgi:6,7-dimethyl-8-ribityllumazine synthase
VSGDGRPELVVPDAKNLRVGIVWAAWHSDLTEVLRERAVAVCQQAGTAEPTVVKVPGAVELAIVAQQLASDHDAVVALGVVVRGGTPHFEYVCDAVTAGLTRVALDSGVPVGNGVLTCDTMEQAAARSGGPDAVEDKGGEAAAAALQAALVLRTLRGTGSGMGFGR